MTREEIEKISVSKPYRFESHFEKIWYEVGCIDGLKAADAEPNLERLWHDVSEEPKDRSNILVRYTYLGCAELRSHRINYNHLPSWSEFIDSNEIEEWAYVSDILPKGGKR